MEHKKKDRYARELRTSRNDEINLKSEEDGLLDKTEYLDLPKRMVAHVLTKSQREIPIVGHNYEGDVTAFWEQYEALRADCGYDLTFNTLMMKVITECLKAAPILNSYFIYHSTSSSGKIEYKKHIDVTMPTLLPGGGMFPIKIKQIENLSLSEIATQIQDVLQRLNNTDIEKALFDLSFKRTMTYLKRGKLATALAQVYTCFFGKDKVAKFSRLFQKVPDDGSVLTKDDFDEGTVCITNWGSLYKSLRGNGTLIPIMYPSVCTIAIGSVQKKQHLYKDENGEIQIGERKFLPLTILFDHRIGGFGDIVPFIKRIDDIFADPSVITSW